MSRCTTTVVCWPCGRRGHVGVPAGLNQAHERVHARRERFLGPPGISRVGGVFGDQRVMVGLQRGVELRGLQPR